VDIAISAIATRYFPTCVHPRNTKWDSIPMNKRPYKVAHRGGACERPENTIMAFDNAVAAGADTLELDVHVTADDQVVVVHDNNLHRLTGENVKVRETPFAKLPKLPKKCPPSIFDATNKWIDSPEPQPMPLLEEVFQRYPDKWINLDLKLRSNDRAKVSKLVAELIRKYNREHFTLWGSGPSYENELKKLSPSTFRFASGNKTILIIFAYFLGFLPLIPLDIDAFEPPVCDDGILKTVFAKGEADAISKGFIGKAVFKLLFYILNQKPLYAHLRARGIMSITWVTNTKEGVKHAFDLGTDALMTDSPQELFKYYPKK
jgi:glycerophosphoryl diester phosphodiesterase